MRQDTQQTQLAAVLLAERSLNATQRKDWLKAVAQLLFAGEMGAEATVLLRDKMGFEESYRQNEEVWVQIFLEMLFARRLKEYAHAGSLFADLAEHCHQLPAWAAEIWEKLAERYLRLDNNELTKEELTEHIDFVRPMTRRGWQERPYCRAGAVLAGLLTREGLRAGMLEELLESLTDAKLTQAEADVVLEAERQAKTFGKDAHIRLGAQDAEFCSRSSFQLVRLLKAGADGVAKNNADAPGKTI